MKQTTFTLLLSVLLSMVGLHVYASGIEVEGICYDFNTDSKTASVTYKGSEYFASNYYGAVVIPSEVTYGGEKYSVTSIGDNAFHGSSNLTSVTIPNSVTSISQQAFSGCSKLTSVTIPNSVTSIGWSAFYGCSGFTSVIIPNSVTSISFDVFGGCSSLTSIVVESGNTKYDSRDNCNAIIETASNKLVAGCKNTVIPNSVTSIDKYAFYCCFGLTSITIPNSVTSIGTSAFLGCSKLASVTIPNSVTSIGSGAFSGCSKLASVTIPNSVTSIGEQAFAHCSGLTSVTIPNSVTSIGIGAFAHCSGLTSITIPNGVTSIGNSAFSGCSGLTSITIPNSVTSIDQYAFRNCSGLKDVYCHPTEVPETKSNAFNDVTTSNVTLHVPSSSLNKYKEHEVWGQFKFGSYSCVSLTYSIDGLSKLKMNILPFDHNLNITAEEGWKVVALTVNGEDKMSSLKNNVLTINISADTEVKVTLGWANEANLYTEDPATGIATIEGEGVKVQAKDGQIWVDGAAGKTVRLYTIGGALMTTVTPTAGNTGKFSVAPGTYIIQVGNKAAKVTVK